MSRLSVTCGLVIYVTCAVGNGATPLIENSAIRPTNGRAGAPIGFEVFGDAVYGNLSDIRREHSGWGVRLLAGEDVNDDKKSSGALATSLTKISEKDGRWFRLRISGMAQTDFHVEKDDLYLKVEFFKNNGSTALDHIKHRFYAQVQQERKDLADPGTNRRLGLTTWRDYSLQFRTPFPEVDTLRVSVGFNGGKPRGKQSEFWINSIELDSIPTPNRFVRTFEPKKGSLDLRPLIHIGGRWYYDSRGSFGLIPPQFDHTNADQLLYLSDKPIAPFAGNTTAWLRTGYLDVNGKLVKRDKFVPDNVVITLGAEHIIVKSKNLPNHPTAVFPDRWRALDGNPNYIAEKNLTWYIPIDPKENSKRVAMKNKSNNDHALPMGPIGIAVNGVVFFNPFDHLLDEDAVWRLDRCCGHPAPNSLYHYHKYPVCVKSPWSDDGNSHSPVIGFAFDGFPIYGPYESKGVLAKELKENALNEFNVHFDKQRGWHYHVTPGQFPHIIGGYWGIADPKNRRSRGPGPRRRPPPR
jgi:hypothetical protein